MVDCMASSTFRLAPLIAAVTRSCNISTSPLFTASGSIFILNTCLRPSILTTTVPPPEVPSTTVSSIFFCSTSYCRFACDINSCKLNPPIASFPLKLKLLSLRPASPLLFIIDNRSDLRSKLLLHAADNRILFRPAAPSAVGRRTARRRARRSVTRDHLQLKRASSNSTGRRDGQPSGIGSERHVDHGRRRCHFDHQLVSLDPPFSAFQHRNQHLMPAARQRVQHRVAQRILLRVIFSELFFRSALWSDRYFGCSLGDRRWSCRSHHHAGRGSTGSRRRNACRGI